MVSPCVVVRGLVLFDLGLDFVVVRLRLLGFWRSRRCLGIALLFLAYVTDQAHVPLELFPLQSELFSPILRVPSYLLFVRHDLCDALMTLS